jgi:hypothetical protein
VVSAIVDSRLNSDLLLGWPSKLKRAWMWCFTAFSFVVVIVDCKLYRSLRSTFDRSDFSAAHMPWVRLGKLTLGRFTKTGPQDPHLTNMHLMTKLSLTASRSVSREFSWTASLTTCWSRVLQFFSCLQHYATKITVDLWNGKRQVYILANTRINLKVIRRYVMEKESTGVISMHYCVFASYILTPYFCCSSRRYRW